MKPTLGDLLKHHDTLQHYGVKGMKWDEKKVKDELKKTKTKASAMASKIAAEIKKGNKTVKKVSNKAINKALDKQDKQDLKNIKKAVSKKIAKKIDDIKAAPGKAVNKAKKRITNAAKHPIQTTKNLTGVTQKEARKRAGDERTIRKLDPDTAKLVDTINSKLARGRAKDKAEAKQNWKNLRENLPKAVKKHTIQKIKNKLGMTEPESKAKAQKTKMDRLNKQDPKLKKVKKVEAPKFVKQKPKLPKKSKNIDDLLKIKFKSSKPKSKNKPKGVVQ